PARRAATAQPAAARRRRTRRSAPPGPRCAASTGRARNPGPAAGSPAVARTGSPSRPARSVRCPAAGRACPPPAGPGSAWPRPARRWPHRRAPGPGAAAAGRRRRRAAARPPGRAGRTAPSPTRPAPGTGSAGTPGRSARPRPRSCPAGTRCPRRRWCGTRAGRALPGSWPAARARGRWGPSRLRWPGRVRAGRSCRQPRRPALSTPEIRYRPNQTGGRLAASMPELFVFGPDDAARTRFTVSPLWETMGALRVLIEPRRHHYHLPWLEAVRPRLDMLDLWPLLVLSPAGGWTPDFLSPVPDGPAPDASAQLARVRATPDDVVALDIERSLTDRTGGPVPEAAWRLLDDPAATRAMLADLLEECWHLLIEPHWPRLRDLLTADVTYRTQVLADYGLERVLDDLHPRVHWAGQALVIDQMPVRARPLGGAGLLLIPSV